MSRVLLAVATSIVALLSAAVASRTGSGGWVAVLLWSGPIALIALVLGCVTWRGRDDVRANLLVALGATAGAVLAVEAALSLVPETDLIDRIRSAAASSGHAFDARRPAEVIRDLRAAGQSVYPVVYGPSLLRVRPDSADRLLLSPAIARTRTLLCNESGGYVFYDSDEHGFNNPVGAWRARASIVLIGDSFVHGLCVLPESSLAGVLRRRWPGVVGLGLSGTGPHVQRAVAREYLGALAPRVVVWAIYEGNDLIDLAVEGERENLRAYADTGFTQQLVQRQPEIDAHYRELLDDALQDAWSAASPPVPPRQRVRIAAVLKLTRFRRLLGLESYLPYSASRMAALAEAARAMRAEGCRASAQMLVLLLPTRRRFAGGRDAGDRFLGRAQLLDVLAGQGLDVVDVSAAFAGHSDPLSLWVSPASHYTSEGYALVASAISPRLRRMLSDSTPRSPVDCGPDRRLSSR